MKHLRFIYFFIFFFTVYIPVFSYSHEDELRDYVHQAKQLNSFFTHTYEWNEFIEQMNYEACLHENEQEQDNILWLASFLSFLKNSNHLEFINYLDELPRGNPFSLWNIFRILALPAVIFLVNTSRFSIPPVFAHSPGSNSHASANMNVFIANPNNENPVHFHLEQATPHTRTLQTLFLLAMGCSGYTSLQGMSSFYNDTKFPYALKKYLKKEPAKRVLKALTENMSNS